MSAMDTAWWAVEDKELLALVAFAPDVCKLTATLTEEAPHSDVPLTAHDAWTARHVCRGVYLYLCVDDHCDVHAATAKNAGKAYVGKVSTISSTLARGLVRKDYQHAMTPARYKSVSRRDGGDLEAV